MPNTQEWGDIAWTECYGGVAKLIKLGWTPETWLQKEARWHEHMRKYEVRHELLHGRTYVSSLELEIIYSDRFSPDEMRAKVAAIREATAEKMALRKSGKGVKRPANVIVFPV